MANEGSAPNGPASDNGIARLERAAGGKAEGFNNFVRGGVTVAFAGTMCVTMLSAAIALTLGKVDLAFFSLVFTAFVASLNNATTFYFIAAPDRKRSTDTTSDATTGRTSP